MSTTEPIITLEYFDRAKRNNFILAEDVWVIWENRQEKFFFYNKTGASYDKLDDNDSLKIKDMFTWESDGKKIIYRNLFFPDSIEEIEYTQEGNNVFVKRDDKVDQYKASLGTRCTYKSPCYVMLDDFLEREECNLLGSHLSVCWYPVAESPILSIRHRANGICRMTFRPKFINGELVNHPPEFYYWSASRIRRRDKHRVKVNLFTETPNDGLFLRYWQEGDIAHVYKAEHIVKYKVKLEYLKPKTNQ